MSASAISTRGSSSLGWYSAGTSGERVDSSVVKSISGIDAPCIALAVAVREVNDATHIAIPSVVVPDACNSMAPRGAAVMAEKDVVAYTRVIVRSRSASEHPSLARQHQCTRPSGQRSLRSHLSYEQLHLRLGLRTVFRRHQHHGNRQRILGRAEPAVRRPLQQHLGRQGSWFHVAQQSDPSTRRGQQPTVFVIRQRQVPSPCGPPAPARMVPITPFDAPPKRCHSRGRSFKRGDVWG